MEYCKRCRRWRPCCPQCGCCSRCCCCPCCSASFTAVKRDRLTGAPIPWASYLLCQNGRPLAAAVSDAAGAVRFSRLPAGVYELTETAAPVGYLPDLSRYRVAVDAACGVTIDGVAADGYTLYGMPVTLSFRKTDAATGLPLEGAVYALSNGDAAASGADGLVNFGLPAPGVYTMTETSAPAGYEADPGSYAVAVAADGSVTVNGQPASDFSVSANRNP